MIKIVAKTLNIGNAPIRIQLYDDSILEYVTIDDFSAEFEVEKVDDYTVEIEPSFTEGSQTLSLTTGNTIVNVPVYFKNKYEKSDKKLSKIQDFYPKGSFDFTDPDNPKTKESQAVNDYFEGLLPDQELPVLSYTNNYREEYASTSLLGFTLQLVQQQYHRYGYTGMTAVSFESFPVTGIGDFTEQVRVPKRIVSSSVGQSRYLGLEGSFLGYVVTGGENLDGEWILGVTTPYVPPQLDDYNYTDADKPQLTEIPSIFKSKVSSMNWLVGGGGLYLQNPEERRWAASYSNVVGEKNNTVQPGLEFVLSSKAENKEKINRINGYDYKYGGQRTSPDEASFVSKRRMFTIYSNGKLPDLKSMDCARANTELRKNDSIGFTNDTELFKVPAFKNTPIQEVNIFNINSRALDGTVEEPVLTFGGEELTFGGEPILLEEGFIKNPTFIVSFDGENYTFYDPDATEFTQPEGITFGGEPVLFGGEPILF